MTTKKTATDTDLLAGYAAIGAFLGFNAQQTKHRARKGQIPVFKMGRTPCATKTALSGWLAKQMASGAQKGGN